MPCPPGGFDLKLCLTSGQVFGWKQLQSVWRGTNAGHTYELGKSDNVMNVVTDATESDFKALFGLTLDLELARKETLDVDPSLGNLFDKLSGMRLMQPQQLDEVIFTFLCTANNHLTRIEMMIAKLQQLGPRLSETQNAWPPIEAIASLSEEILREWGFGYRARTIPLVAKELLGWGDWETQLKALPYLEARKTLQSLPGLGPKLADCISLYGLHHHEAVPVDTHLWQAVTARYFPEWQNLTPTGKRMWDVGEALRDKFGKWAGYVQLVLYYGNMKHRDLVKNREKT